MNQEIQTLIQKHNRGDKCSECRGEGHIDTYIGHHRRMICLCLGTGQPTTLIPIEWVECQCQKVKRAVNARRVACIKGCRGTGKVPKYNEEDKVLYCLDCDEIVKVRIEDNLHQQYTLKILKIEGQFWRVKVE